MVSPRVRRYLVAVFLLLLAAGCAGAPPQASTPATQQPDTVHVAITSAEWTAPTPAYPAGVWVTMNATSTRNVDLYDINMSVEVYNQPNQPGRIRYGQTVNEHIGIPASGVTNLKVFVPFDGKVPPPTATQPFSVGAGYFGPFRPDGTWDSAISNWEQYEKRAA